MIKEFVKNNISILKVYHCPHSPKDDCKCRKPNIGMIEQAVNDYKIDLENSWLIGDKDSDIQTAKNANIKNSILIKSIYTKKETNTSYTANNLFDTINIIKN